MSSLYNVLSSFNANTYLICYLLVTIAFTLFVFMVNLYLQSKKVDIDEEKYTIDLVARALVKTGRVITTIFIIKLTIFVLSFFAIAVILFIQSF